MAPYLVEAGAVIGTYEGGPGVMARLRAGRSVLLSRVFGSVFDALARLNEEPLAVSRDIVTLYPRFEGVGGERHLSSVEVTTGKAAWLHPATVRT